MTFQPDKNTISWKVHCKSPPQQVFAALATDNGRSKFWAESTQEKDGKITYNILNYEPYTGRVFKKKAPTQLTVEYFGTIVNFTLQKDGNNGTELCMQASEVPESIINEMTAGWVSVLLALKAYVDHGVDLRNHDSQRAWGNGYVDN